MFILMALLALTVPPNTLGSGQATAQPWSMTRVPDGERLSTVTVKWRGKKMAEITVYNETFTDISDGLRRLDRQSPDWEHRAVNHLIWTLADSLENDRVNRWQIKNWSKYPPENDLLWKRVDEAARILEKQRT